MGHPEMSTPYLEAIRRGFSLAHELDQRCGPVHLLVGIAEGEGPAGARRSTRARARPCAPLLPQTRSPSAQHPAVGRTAGLGHLHMQAQGAAMALAESRGEQVGAEHLLIVLLDQGTASVLEALGRAGLDPGTARQTAATAIGAPALPPVDLPALTPVGTLDRAPLPVSELDGRAWATLGWRQDHLPVGKLRRPSDREALLNLERAEAWRIADRLAVDDDQRYSLVSHHEDPGQTAGGTRPAGPSRSPECTRPRPGESDGAGPQAPAKPPRPHPRAQERHRRLESLVRQPSGGDPRPLVPLADDHLLPRRAPTVAPGFLPASALPRELRHGLRHGARRGSGQFSTAGSRSGSSWAYPVCLKPSLVGIQIARGPADPSARQEVIGRRINVWEELFSVRSGEGLGWVLAGSVHGREDHQDRAAPPIFDGRGLKPGERDLLSVLAALRG